MLIIVLGVLMASQLPDAYSPPAPISAGFTRSPSGQPTNALPNSLADVNGGSRKPTVPSPAAAGEGEGAIR